MEPLSLSAAFKLAKTDSALLAIAEKVQNKERITEAEGMLLFEKALPN